MRNLPEERMLTETPGRTNLVLTTHRVRLDARSTGSAEVISMMLDEVASCGLVRTSQPVFLILAALSFIGGIALGDQAGSGGAVVGVILAVVFAGLYFATRKQVLALASAGDTIRVQTRGMSLDALVAFIDSVEEAKNARYMLKR